MLILASQSAIRRKLLADAGVQHIAMSSPYDEAKGKQQFSSASPRRLALALATGKAEAISRSQPDALVIGADQTLDFAGQAFDKPKDLEIAHRQLRKLRGQGHKLHSALACMRQGKLLWKHVSSAHLTMRDFSDAFLDNYLADEGDSVLTSVGGYKLEGRGIQLFSKIRGDYHTILGLPLLPLLEFLRQESLVLE